MEVNVVRALQNRVELEKIGRLFINFNRVLNIVLASIYTFDFNFS